MRLPDIEFVWNDKPLAHWKVWLITLFYSGIGLAVGEAILSERVLTVPVWLLTWAIVTADVYCLAAWNSDED